MPVRHIMLFTTLSAAVLLSATAQAGGCEPTPIRLEGEGDEFRPVTRAEVDIGKGLVVHGRILGAPDCRPVPGARIAHWQAGAAGEYVDHLRAWLVSGADGGYRFETEWPALPLPHIHFTVTAEGYRSLTTMWVGAEPVEQVGFDIILAPE